MTRQKKKMYNILRIFLFALLAWGAARFCHRETAGFRLSKIRGNVSPISLPNASAEEEHEAREILKAKFSYFGRGLQSFVFLSEDGNYVLKIFNNRRQRKISWLKLLPLSEWQKNTLHYTAQKLETMFKSCILAHDALKEESALIYLHLNQTGHLKQTITLIDKLNIAHTIDADATAFAIQKKATLVYPALTHWIEKGEKEQAQTALVNLLQLLMHKFHSGIADNDPLMRTNFGFIGTRAVQIDIGPFSRDLTMQEPAVYTTQMHKITASLHKWLEERDPSLAQFFEEQLEKTLSPKEPL